MKAVLCLHCKAFTEIPVSHPEPEYCWDCMLEIVTRAHQFVIAHQEEYDLLKTSNSMDNDPEFLNLCEAVLRKVK